MLASESITLLLVEDDDCEGGDTTLDSEVLTLDVLSGGDATVDDVVLSAPTFGGHTVSVTVIGSSSTGHGVKVKFGKNGAD